MSDNSLTVIPTTHKRDECSMCTRDRDNPNVTYWKMESTNPHRRMVIILCGECVAEFRSQTNGADHV